MAVTRAIFLCVFLRCCSRFCFSSPPSLPHFSANASFKGYPLNRHHKHVLHYSTPTASPLPCPTKAIYICVCACVEEGRGISRPPAQGKEGGERERDMRKRKRETHLVRGRNLSLSRPEACPLTRVVSGSLATGRAPSALWAAQPSLAPLPPPSPFPPPHLSIICLPHPFTYYFLPQPVLPITGTLSYLLLLLFCHIHRTQKLRVLTILSPFCPHCSSLPPPWYSFSPPRPSLPPRLHCSLRSRAHAFIRELLARERERESE